MRRISVLRGILVVVAIALLALARAPFAQAANIAFRGGPEDHFWDIGATFCKDGFKIAANEIEHLDQNNQPNGRGDDKPYSLVITTTSALITDPLPASIGPRFPGGASHPLASATAYFAYATPQLPTTPISVTIERWDHGDLSVIDTGEDSPGDDRDTISGVTANCTLLTAPVFDIPPSPKNGASMFAAPGQLISFSVEGSDADGSDSVTVSATDLPAGASFSLSATTNPVVGTFSWTPTPDQQGAHVVKFSTTDATGRTTAPYAVTINVGPKVFVALVSR